MPSDEASPCPPTERRSQPSESALEQKLASLPVQPGCYIFKDKQGAVLYVGKAKSLRSRVRSYFQDGGSDVRAFIPFLRKHAADLETVVTATEKEAAVLENSLIKERKPRYNVKLRDDKEFLSLRLAAEHAFPRLDLVRKPKKDGARYYGPYHSATAARRTLNLVEKHFKLRTCTDREMAGRKRPCLEYQIQRCLAPCVLEVDKELYGSQVRAVGLFLEGRHDELTRDLKERMKNASQNLEFELAGMYRDQLSAVESAHEAQRVVVVSDRDQDVLGVYREGDLAELCVMVVRKGRMIDTATFSMKNVELPDDEVVATFLREHYGEGGSGEAHVPDEIIVPVLPEGVDGVSEWLMERRAEVVESRRTKVEVLAPARGPRRALLEMASDNAKHAFEEKRRAADDIDERLARVQERLRLPTLPRRIECCDISHLGGADTVGAVVALKDGQLDKKRYRSYIVRTVGEGDDYGAMYEVLSRRFRRGKLAKAKQEPNPAAAPLGTEAETGSENEAEWQLPDLFVVDGGRGQLGVALAAAHDLGLHELCIVGLAKEKENVAGEKLVDRVYLPGQKNPIPLRPNSPELFLLARARDEAHRFSNRGRTKVGKRRRFGSELDAIAGIGPKTRTSLLKTLGSVAALRAATDEQILAVPGVTERHLRALREAFATSAAPSGDAATPTPTEVTAATDVGDAPRGDS
ncbi:MAG TPA: excinuclease ABC subunit UvrC [Polyangiaceae bacterium]|nr:excinuclease ABC subunit UvrC [Polyangiaceae bacterium]